MPSPINNRDLVVKSNYLVEASYRLTTQEQRLLLHLVSLIKPNDQDFHSYQIRIKEFNELIGIQDEAGYSRTKALTKTLRERTVIIRDPKNDTELQAGWLSSAKYFNRKGYVELRFDPELKPYLLQLKEFFTQYEFKNVIQLKRVHSIRLYELLKQYERIGERLFEVEELKRIMGIRPDEYKFYANFKKKVLEPARIELKKRTDLNFNYKEKKQGHKIVHLLFKIKSQKINTEEPEAPAGDESEIKNVELNKRLQEYYRLSRDQAKWVLGEHEKDPDRVLQNLEYVKKRFVAGSVKNIGSYTLKAIKQNYTDQPSLFKTEMDQKTRKNEANQLEQENQREYERFIRNKVKNLRDNLDDSELKKIEAQAILQVGPKKQKFGHDKLIKLTMDEIIKKNHNLPTFEEWQQNHPEVTTESGI